MSAIIERYLTDMNMNRLKRDFGFLLNAVKNSHGELELAFRKSRVTVYYRGNILAEIVFRPADKYDVDIHKKFFEPADLIMPRSKKNMHEEANVRSYYRLRVDARGALQLLQRKNIDRLKKVIRKVNHSEELAFEQILIADNQPSREFILIDRQVQAIGGPGRLDLLGLRLLKNGQYRFVVIEVKLGNNSELSNKVADQLKRYIEHIEDKENHKENAKQYADCYTINYRQKYALGLLGGSKLPAPDDFKIDRNVVEGVVIVGGYTNQAKAQIEQLKKENRNIKVKLFSNRLVDDGGTPVWTT